MIPIAVWATIMTVIPGFLAGALAVQVADEFMVSESVYGWALGAFFLAATAGSIGLGRLAQRVGARSQMIGSLAVSSVASWAIVGAARSFTVFAVLLAVSGLANSANQSAVNLLLSRADLPRLGLAMALKQSGMPVAALLGGLAVPAIATTVGWRWAYATCAVGALAAILVISSKVQKDSTQEVSVQGKADRLDSTERDMKPATPLNSLVRAAIGFGCLAYAAGSLRLDRELGGCAFGHFGGSSWPLVEPWRWGRRCYPALHRRSPRRIALVADVWGRRILSCRHRGCGSAGSSEFDGHRYCDDDRVWVWLGVAGVHQLCGRSSKSTERSSRHWHHSNRRVRRGV